MSLFSDVDAPYPFLQLSSLKNGVFDTACKSKEVTKYDLVAIGQKADLSLSEFSSIKIDNDEKVCKIADSLLRKRFAFDIIQPSVLLAVAGNSNYFHL